MTLAAFARTVLLRPASLRHRTINATIWSVADLGASYALRLASNLILTRILLPDAFGAVAIVTTIQIGLVLVTDLAIHRSIVQSPKGDDPKFLRVSWVVQALWRSALAVLVVIASILLWWLAPHFAPRGTVYADPELPGLVALSSLTMVASGFESTNIWLAVRRMQLGRIAILNALSQIVVVAAVLLFTRFNATAWAILWGMVGSAVFRMLLSQRIFAGPRMGFEWDNAIAGELWRMSRWLVISSVFTFLASNIDRLVLGGILSSEIFGYYTIAGIWVQAASAVVARLTDPIGYSAFSETRRTNPSKAGDIYVKFRSLNDFARLVIFLGMLVFLHTLILFLYPTRYGMTAAFIPVLSVSILASRFELLRIFVLSSGDSLTTMYTAAAQTLALVILLPLGYWTLGIGGALLGSALSPLGSAPLLLFKSRWTLNQRQLSIEVVAASVVILTALVVLTIFAGPVNKL